MTTTSAQDAAVITALVIIRRNVESGRIVADDFPKWRAAAVHVVNSNPTSAAVDRAFSGMLSAMTARAGGPVVNSVLEVKA